MGPMDPTAAPAAMSTPVRTWLAVGDSFTAGTGDDDDGGGWVRRTYAAISEGAGLHALDLRAVEGATVAEVWEHQVRPDDSATIVSVIAGANDIMRPHVDTDQLVAQLDKLLGWADTCADLVVSATCPDFGVPRGRSVPRIRRRVDLINDHMLAWADRRGSVIVIDTLELLDTPGLWAPDRIHPSPAGHRLLAEHAIAALQP